MHLYHLHNYYLGLESSIGVKLSKNIIHANGIILRVVI